MREAARCRAGFYAAPDAAIDAVLPWFNRAVDANCLDPCAGEGDALLRLTNGLGIGLDNVYAIELDQTRGQRCRDKLIGNVLAPCSAFGCEVSSRAFSLVYGNPPFDDSIGGGRVELEWMSRCTPLVAVGGCLLMVVPQATAERFDFRKAWGTFFENVRAMPFPSSCRKFNETFVCGVKREQPDMTRNSTGWYEDWLRERWTYTLPAGTPPKAWKKTSLTDEELEAAMDASPLNRLLDAPEEKPLPSPPMALGLGHLALLLASGLMGGYVEAGKDSHVVRGTARKVEEVSDETSETTESRGVQTVKSVTTFTERIRLVVRTVDRAGFIQSLS